MFILLPNLRANLSEISTSQVLCYEQGVAVMVTKGKVICRQHFCAYKLLNHICRWYLVFLDNYMELSQRNWILYISSQVHFITAFPLKHNVDFCIFFDNEATRVLFFSRCFVFYQKSCVLYIDMRIIPVCKHQMPPLVLTEQNKKKSFVFF